MRHKGILFLSAALLIACNPQRWLPEGQVWLRKIELTEKGSVRTEDKYLEKHLVIEPYIDFYDTDSTTYLDYSDNIDRSKPIKIKPMAELNARYYQFKFKQDSDYYNEEYRKKYAEGYGYYQVEEIKKRLQNLSEKVHTVKNLNLEKAMDEYISIAKGRDLNRGEITKIVKKNNVPNTGMLYKTLDEVDALREIPIDSDLAKSNKAKALREIQENFTDLTYETSTGKYRVRGTNTVNLSHMDDKYSQYVTTNNLGYAPQNVNAELLKPFDEAMHNIYLEREKLLKDKPPGFEIELEKLNQRGISLADRSQGFKNFNVVQPDESSYSYTPDIKRTIDPADLLKGKKDNLIRQNTPIKMKFHQNKKISLHKDFNILLLKTIHLNFLLLI
jgi:virulence-associated protein VapD